MCGSMVDTESPTAENRGEKRKKETTAVKYNVRICYAGRSLKNRDAQNKWSSHKVCGVSPEAQRGSMVGQICDRGRF